MAHILVDGYNFIRRIPLFAETERAGLESARESLLMALEEYGVQHGYTITAVFDGGGRPECDGALLPSKDRFAGIDVIFSGKGQSADVIILEMLETARSKAMGDPESSAEEMIVVTDDYGLRDEAIERGAYVKSAHEFFKALEEGHPIEY